MEDDAEGSDLDRRQRDLERRHTRTRRQEKADDKYKRREAELNHSYEMRQFERKRGKYRLEEDKHEWKRIESEEKERTAAEGAEMIRARRKAEEEQARELQRAEDIEKAKLEAEQKKAEEAKKKAEGEKTGWLWW